MRIGQATGPSQTPSDLGFLPPVSLALITSVEEEEEEEEQAALCTAVPVAVAAVGDPTKVQGAAIPRG